MFRKRTSSNALPGRRSFAGETRASAGQTDRQHVFARNRTLTGSTSTRLSGASKYADLQSPRTQAHHLALHRRKIGLVFLGVIAVMPVLVSKITGMTNLVIGGTGILIVVSVILETFKKVESQLMMRNYDRFVK